MADNNGVVANSAATTTTITEANDTDEKLNDVEPSAAVPMPECAALPPAAKLSPALPPSSSSLFDKKHHLKNRWTLWFLNNKKDLDWVKRLNNVCTLRTVEAFWALYDNIRPPSALIGCDYNLFKEGIEPMWEVPQNKKGGRLVIVVDKGRMDLLDAFWLELLMSLIGEQFGDNGEDICGAVCNIRQKGSKISLWITNAANDEVNRRIGTIMKNRLMSVASGRFNQSIPLKVCFEDHNDVQQKQSSAIASRFII